ncbi:hypothetical protein KUCAC02_019955 [Chaenocephalus aceratus]|uniref:Uncharacterized protein n=1 Tax=Chaenocephalus aceratus TaxID=36190 RepID=A0ACB9VPX2_CHAAC|nr:hypothetical protein KUCAC02_019955 [Chaenocephalus aceratus]
MGPLPRIFLRTDEPSLFDGLFIAQDSKVSAFVDKIRSQMTISRYDNRAGYAMEPQEGGESPQDTLKEICQSKTSMLHFKMYIKNI